METASEALWRSGDAADCKSASSLDFIEKGLAQTAEHPLNTPTFWHRLIMRTSASYPQPQTQKAPPTRLNAEEESVMDEQDRIERLENIVAELLEFLFHNVTPDKHLENMLAELRAAQEKSPAD